MMREIETPVHERMQTEEYPVVLALARARDLEIALAGNPPTWRNAHLDRLVLANQNLIVAAARRHGGSAGTFADRVQDGNVAFLMAYRTWNAAFGNTFAAYARTTIKRYIMEQARNRGMLLRVPSNPYWLTRKYRRALDEIIAKEMRTPSYEEVCERINFETLSRKLNVSANVMRDALQVTGMERTAYTASIHDSPSHPDPCRHERETMDRVDSLLGAVSPEKRDAILLWCGIETREPISFATMASRTGMTKVACNKRVSRAIEEIRGWVASGSTPAPFQAKHRTRAKQQSA